MTVEISKENQVTLFLSGLEACTGKGELGPDLLKRLEMTLKIFKECSREFHKKEFHVIVSGGVVYPGQKFSVAKIMKLWLERNGIPRHCILVENGSQNNRESVRFVWQSYLIGLERGQICIVSQSLQAWVIQKMLEGISSGKCPSIIRACQYADWRACVRGVRHFFCQQTDIAEMCFRGNVCIRQ